MEVKDLDHPMSGRSFMPTKRPLALAEIRLEFGAEGPSSRGPALAVADRRRDVPHAISRAEW